MRINELLALAIAPTLINAWRVVYYENERCRGESLSSQDIAETDSTCQTSHSSHMRAQSARIEGLSYISDNFRGGFERLLRFYDTQDCSSTCSNKHVIAEGEASWSGNCISWPLAIKNEIRMLSFNLVEQGQIGLGGSGWRNGAVLSDGICNLKHGDELFFQGRSYRMQQIAETWFKEIPVNLWDPSVHTRNTTRRFVQHGDVDSFGLFKYLQYYEDYDPIKLEFWDEEKHVAVKSRVDRPRFYERLVEGLCEDATVADIDRGLLLKKIPNVDEICRGWVDGEFIGDIDYEQFPMQRRVIFDGLK